MSAGNRLVDMILDSAEREASPLWPIAQRWARLRDRWIERRSVAGDFFRAHRDRHGQPMPHVTDFARYSWGLIAGHADWLRLLDDAASARQAAGLIDRLAGNDVAAVADEGFFDPHRGRL